MGNPDWAKVVQILYRESPHIPPAEINENHQFVTETDFDAEKAEDVLETLVDWNLVGQVETKRKAEEYDPSTGEMVNEEIEYGYKLTSQGFEVAHERELTEGSQDINFSLVFLTYVLVLTQIIDAVSLPESWRTAAMIGLVLALSFVVWRTDLLER